ncbi:hairy-related 12 isoform X1 [Eucyclogobius newberryi]|uniref:hairy-related 12 isoform X1 n=1 Tax=Eucyclogobius newberryi TaxID=166745 RepID=UPI003B5B81FE
MAPYSSFSTFHQTRTERDHIKLRKPVVEKMRRDRINGCIEQLKILLEKELHREGCPKLEKADVLEMTVCFLRQQLGQPHRPQMEVHGAPQMEVHSAPLMEVHKTPHKEIDGAAQKKVHKLPQTEACLQSSTTSPQPRDTASNSAPVWRPW